MLPDFESLQIIDHKAANTIGLSLCDLLISENVALKKNNARKIKDPFENVASIDILDEVFLPSCDTFSDWHKIEQQLDEMATNRKEFVIFVAQKVYFNQMKMSIALRDSGYTTVAIVFDEDMIAHQKNSFDRLIYTDLSNFLLYINKVQKPLLLHTQGWLFRYHIPVLINIYKSKYCRQIVEIMDSQAFYLPDSALNQALGAMQLAWGDNALENHKLQSICEAYIIEYADGVIFNGNDGYRESLLGDCVNKQKNNRLSFPSWPLRNFFSSSCVTNFEIKLVFIGGIPPLTQNRPHELFGDAQLLTVVEKLISKGCYLDIYNNPLIAHEEDYPVVYKKFFELSSIYKNFNFYLGDYPHLISQKIANYDYGLMIYDFDGICTGDLHFKYLIPTKLFSYLEAGLPVLVSSRFEAVCEIVLKYKIGVVINDIDCISDIIEKLNIDELKENVLKAREEIQMHSNIHRLIDLYNRVID